jgi:hypothetical protein
MTQIERITDPSKYQVFHLPAEQRAALAMPAPILFVGSVVLMCISLALTVDFVTNIGYGCIPICLTFLLFAFLLGPYLIAQSMSRERLAHRTQLVVSGVGIEYHTAKYSIVAAWKDVKGIETKQKRGRSLDCLVCDHVEVTGSYFWMMVDGEMQIDCAIPIGYFGDWGFTRLGYMIREHAPHLFNPTERPRAPHSRYQPDYNILKAGRSNESLRAFLASTCLFPSHDSNQVARSPMKKVSYDAD